MPTQISGTTGVNQVSFGTVLQIVEATPVSTSFTVSEAIPIDSTVPQITEGKRIHLTTITPVRANSRIRVHVLLPFVDSGSAAGAAILTLFVNGASSAVALGTATIASSNYPTQVQLEYEFSATSLSPITLESRLGTFSGQTLTVNLRADSNNFGGISSARMTVTEVQA